jgi:magnesium transporter
MTVEEAITYLRRQSRHLETIYYVYVLDSQQRLLGVVSFRELLSAPAGRPVSSIMHVDVVSVPESLDQEAVAQLFRQHGFLALPVVDDSGRVQGIVTSDDIVDVLHEEATEDIQKIGGMEALDTPYLRTSLFEMVKKRGGWLTFLFFGGTLTASAMGYFEEELSRAVVLALFLPLIIASGGNAGAQATTLVIRAMALGEVRMGDWWRVVRREFLSGLALGLLLAVVAIVWVIVWETTLGLYGEHYLRVGLSVALSLVGVVTWGTLAGSTLPFVLRRLGLDPASASAPFVATLVDVVGVVIYFSVARWVLAGTLL